MENNKDPNKEPKKGDRPVRPSKYIPAKPDENPDSTKRKGDDPEKSDPTRISQPEKNDPTRTDDFRE